jgi:hypothetical protein
LTGVSLSNWKGSGKNGKLRADDYYAVAHQMMSDGWIRKADHDSYHFHAHHIGTHRHRVLKHLREYHPETNRVNLQVTKTRKSWKDWRGGMSSAPSSTFVIDIPKLTAEELIEAKLIEARKVLRTDPENAERRHKGFVSKIVRPGVRPFGYTDAYEYEPESYRAKLFQASSDQEKLDTYARKGLGAKLWRQQSQKDIVKAVAAQPKFSYNHYKPKSTYNRASDKFTLNPESMPIHPSIVKEADRAHAHVVRKLVKAGVVKKIHHSSVKGEKILVPGDNFHKFSPEGSGIRSMIHHDALEHGTLGADVSTRGEAMADHVGYIHSVLKNEHERASRTGGIPDWGKSHAEIGKGRDGLLYDNLVDIYHDLAHRSKFGMD